MVSSVLNEGVRGLQNSQREILRSANEVARANIRPEQASETQVQANEETTFAPVSQSSESQRSGDLSQSLVELRRQEQIFTANAQTISVANQALGSLIDIQS